jgi:hypothetical protein
MPQRSLDRFSVQHFDFIDGWTNNFGITHWMELPLEPNEIGEATMDFEQELQELTDAAREAGVSLVDIIAALNAHVVTLTGEGALEEEAEHAEDEDDDQP